MCYIAVVIDYLEGLNERQREAALHDEGPLLIVAGAGAGKTKTITHRIARLIDNVAPAREILAVTFTNRAAGEMRERVRQLTPEAGTAATITTFHALGVRLLREFHWQAGVPRDFSIWDRDDSVRALKRVLEALEIAGMAPRAALAAISRRKNEGGAPEELAGGSMRERTLARLWRAYEEALSAEGALDFEDLLGRTVKLLRGGDDVRQLLERRWTYLTVDEYQDTNLPQYEIARLLAGERRNICVVGDTDQNIYSWRGADLGHLLEFEKDFPGAKVITLEQNYRSTRTILAAANGVIEKNRRRKPKTLYTDRQAGEPIELYEAGSETDEAWYAASRARQLMEAGTSAREIAVLYRENFQSRALEEAMLHLDVPYRVLGTRFFERKEVKDVLSYLRAALNPQARGDFARAAGAPPRGIGKRTLEKMLAGSEESLIPALRRKAAAFRECLAKIRHGIEVLPTSEAVANVIDAAGIGKLYRESDEGRERLANIGELVNFAARFDDERPPEGVLRLLEEAALESDQDQLDERNAVSLMTAHAAKGLEFDAVFVVGLEQGLFPSTRQDEPRERDPEEERRLFYVALTRARDRLFLSWARQRMRYGSREIAGASEFLDDIDPRLVQAVARKRSLLADDEYTIS